MIQARIIEPLSPPSSPRMSGQDYKPVIPGWQPHQEHQPSFGEGHSHGAGHHITPREPAPNNHGLGIAQGPSLRSYKTSPYPLNAHIPPSSNITTSQYAHQTPEDQKGALNSLPRPSAGTEQHTYRSVPGSPASRLSPQSQGGEENFEIADDGEPDASGDLDDDNKPPMTATELRNQKRKLKRFRLTHNQTRFLMSEFARQAHPDAAHRERLAREIPGLSPRQVQVWFQNRRAKLKRLTVEDRERMMISRALPENFDMTPSLHNSFGGNAPGGVTPGASPASYGTVMHQSGHIRPLTLDTMRRGEIGPSYVSTVSGMSSMAYTPPQSATDTMSPVSGAPEIPTYGYPPRSALESPRRTMFPGPHASGPPSYTSQYTAQPPRLVHDRFRRTSGETAASSPLRSSMSYGSISGESSQQQAEVRTPGLQATEGQGYISHQDSQRNMPPPSNPFGLGFPPYGMQYQSSVRPQQPPTSGGQNLEMVNTYQRDSQQLLSQHPSAFPEYQQYQNPTPYPTPQMPQYANFGPQYASSSSYSGPYVQRTEQQQQQREPPAPSTQRQQFAGQRGPDSEEDASDEGAPIASY